MMKSLRKLSHLVFLLTIFPLFAFPQNRLSYVSTFEDFQPVQAVCKAMTYDDILELLLDLESGVLEVQKSYSKLEEMNWFITLLAREGRNSADLYEEVAFEEDINSLLNDESPFEYVYPVDLNERSRIVPAIWRSGHAYDVVYCGWLSKKWKKTKDFVKNHKKEILIGAAVVVAVAVVTVAIVAAASANTASAAAAAGAAAAGMGSNSDTTSQSEEASHSSEGSNSIKESIEKHTAHIKEVLGEDQGALEADDVSFAEKAREIGAQLAHQIYDEVSEVVKVVPEVFEEVKELGQKILPEGFAIADTEFNENCLKIYDNLVGKGHAAIDEGFSTNQAESFSSQAKASMPRPELTLGIIPIPGMVSGESAINVRGFSLLGKINDRAGFSKAGRGLMKHGYREGSSFPKPVGNPSQVNQQGQRVLENILTHPDKQVYQYIHKRFGPVIDIEVPGIGGARFNGDATDMIGFLQPNPVK